MSHLLPFVLLIATVIHAPTEENKHIWVDVEYLSTAGQDTYVSTGQIEADVYKSLTSKPIYPAFIKLINCRYWSEENNRFIEFADIEDSGEVLVPVRNIVCITRKAQDPLDIPFVDEETELPVGL